ncbi:MAG TPA: hypothetical protein VEJ63_10320, partial [Planctomycetota bacterium]|nr:hypothetical protein [Planctomycetota bacterium]
VFDRLSALSSPEIRNAIMNSLTRIASREPGARTAVLERLLDYSRAWDQAGKRLGSTDTTRISGMWKKLSLGEKIIFRALSSLGDPGARALKDIVASLGIFEPLVPEIELRLKLDIFVERGVVIRTEDGRYEFAEDQDRRHVQHFGDLPQLIREHPDEFLSMLSFENFANLSSSLKRSKHITQAQWLDCFGLETNDWKSRETFLHAAQDWRKQVLSNASSRDVNRAADVLVKDHASRIRFEILQTGQTDDFLYFSGKKLGLRNQKLSKLTLLLPKRGDVDANAIKRLDEWILRESLTQQIFVVLTAWPDKSHLGEEADASPRDIVVLEEKHVFKQAFAHDPDQAFMNMVLESCDLESLSPYESQAPVREMFYGREGLIKEILRSTKGYALVGTRRLGKTSLLFRLQDEIRKRPKAETIFLECGGVTDSLALAERLSIALKFQLPQAFSLPDFERALRRWIDSSGKELYCFFDEIDDFVATGKEAEPLWQIFKSLAFEGRMTVYVAGFSELFSRFRDYESLFFNFLLFRKLSYLDRQSAVALVTHPMQELGLTFEDPETLVASILEKTSTHPNIIQIFCDLLVKRMARRKRRVILGEDIEETARHPEFEESIVRIMQSNLIRPVEKLLLLLVAYYNVRPLSGSQVSELLADWEISISQEKIAEILDRLVLYAVFEEREGQYDFAHPYFATILQHRDVESMITYYCDEVNKDAGKADGKRKR